MEAFESTQTESKLGNFTPGTESLEFNQSDSEFDILVSDTKRNKASPRCTKILIYIPDSCPETISSFTPDSCPETISSFTSVVPDSYVSYPDFVPDSYDSYPDACHFQDSASMESAAIDEDTCRYVNSYHYCLSFKTCL
jgi:hypothetical protein